jgi:tRNA threonylcarbamoyl adenosine modification protein YeaZ
MQLAIECASDEPGIALAVGGVAALVLTWATQRNHSVELLPNIDRLLGEAGRTKADIDAVFVDTGPGGYAALRAGVSVAKAISHALAAPIAGVGRLEVDAYGVVQDAAGRRIIAVHRAGRDESAWAAYQRSDGVWAELAQPRIGKTAALYAELRAGDAVAGELDEALAQEIQRAGAALITPQQHRVVALAELGHRRIAAGRADDPTTLVPLYLRAPAIGPQ